jgi:hypothetical protein
MTPCSLETDVSEDLAASSKTSYATGLFYMSPAEIQFQNGLAGKCVYELKFKPFKNIFTACPGVMRPVSKHS